MKTLRRLRIERAITKDEARIAEAHRFRPPLWAVTPAQVIMVIELARSDRAHFTGLVQGGNHAG